MWWISARNWIRKTCWTWVEREFVWGNSTFIELKHLIIVLRRNQKANSVKNYLLRVLIPAKMSRMRVSDVLCPQNKKEVRSQFGVGVSHCFSCWKFASLTVRFTILHWYRTVVYYISISPRNLKVSSSFMALDTETGSNTEFRVGIYKNNCVLFFYNGLWLNTISQLTNIQ